MDAEAWDKAAKQVNFNLEIEWSKFQSLVCPQARLLDFGCGYGRIGKKLIHNGYLNVVGVDSAFCMVLRG
ncbi:class I SAM-dependent methyltransferase [Gilvimarinus xylanilyticus]|uniref:Class I SAM-dependent methyltransferase n=1 Tax=Gilvimarinus xylanilyticus TaxID=2944139 RepID=A0A9X2I124_9GAMM|nr:class I SAM-dependent methyltransferase [Gilvimarinus xylanilyticus]MCP8898703.1 class I SAM-dependent methyltransferase [Gilvimarinus xylanilyticus]